MSNTQKSFVIKSSNVYTNPYPDAKIKQSADDMYNKTLEEQLESYSIETAVPKATKKGGQAIRATNLAQEDYY